MGDAADMLLEAAEGEYESHLAGYCSLDDDCWYCRHERSLELRGPADPDEMEDLGDA